ncbi:SDR family NAD(P)-dependent oxidoreductase [Candidatus Poriferisocius sp.]|uniref:SDR family NAD(P)-dependent oxidoreductase n=1 Tax=Candidatus Poriferisocius sp. TaxID=3101276 RepID=UPI003B5AFB7B
MGRLDGKVALVTGGGGGLGTAISTLFASEGAQVVVQDLNEAAAAATAELVAANGGEAMSVACDVSDSKAIEAMFADIDARFGPVTVLVNNAGVDRTPGDGSGEGNTVNERQVVDMSDDGWQRMLDIHLNGAFYCTRAMLARLLGTGIKGSIVNMSSIAGLAGWGPIHYATAKAGLLGFTRAMARFSSAAGIRTNAVCPGVIDTPMTQSIGQDMVEGLKMLTPAGRVGTPDDIAHAALYLASDESDFVTGEYITPNGGLVIG